MSVNTAAQALVDLKTIRPRGEWYDATVPDTLDLAQRAELAINVLTQDVDPERFYGVYQGFSFNRKGTDMRGFTWNINQKNARGLPWMRTICGSDRHMDVEYGMMRAMLGQIDKDGQVYVPVDSDSVPKGTSNPAISGRLVMTMANWYARDKNPAWLDLIKQVSVGMQRIAIHVEDRAYYPLECGWRPDGTWHYELRRGRMLLPYTPPHEPVYDQQGVEGSVKDYGAIPLRAFVWCYKLTGDKASLTLAEKLSRYVLKPSMWVDTSAEGYPGFEHGIFEGHFHGNITPLFTLFELALVGDNAWLKEFVKEGYDTGRRNGITRIGWFPAWTHPRPNSTWKDGRRPQDHNNRAPVDGGSDMMLLAIKLSDAGVGDYWDDVDHIVRNHFVEEQFTNLDLMRECVGGDPKHDPVLKRFLGGFASSAHPTCNMPVIAGGASANGSIGLYYAWHGITRFNAGVARVNLFLNRASSWMDIDSYLPYQGKVVLHNKRARTALVRIPSWLEMAKVKSYVRNRPVDPARSGSYLVFQDLKPKDEIRLEFPVPEFTEKYTIAGQQYTLKFRGSTLVDISPRESTPATYPIYQRDALLAKVAPMIKVRRFVSDNLLPIQ